MLALSYVGQASLDDLRPWLARLAEYRARADGELRLTLMAWRAWTCRSGVAALAQCRGRLTEYRGEIDEAVSQYQVAASAYEALPAPYFAATVTEREALCLLPTDPDKATEQLSALMDVFDDLGATPATRPAADTSSAARAAANRPAEGAAATGTSCRRGRSRWPDCSPTGTRTGRSRRSCCCPHALSNNTRRACCASSVSAHATSSSSRPVGLPRRGFVLPVGNLAGRAGAEGVLPHVQRPEGR